MTAAKKQGRPSKADPEAREAVSNGEPGVNPVPPKLTKAKVKADSSRLYKKLVSIVERDLDASLSTGNEISAATITAFSKVICLQAEMLANSDLFRDEVDHTQSAVVLPEFDEEGELITKTSKPKSLNPSSSGASIRAEYDAMLEAIKEHDDVDLLAFDDDAQ